MDLKSAMETFAEAWVAVNTKSDQVQVNRVVVVSSSSSEGEVVLPAGRGMGFRPSR